MRQFYVNFAKGPRTYDSYVLENDISIVGFLVLQTYWW